MLGNQNRKKISMDSTMHHMQETQRARIKRTLDHMAEHDGNIKYDKYTGEIHYDGVKAADSDLRELLSTLTSKKKRITAPKGWDLFVRSLKDTDAPADIHLGAPNDTAYKWWSCHSRQELLCKLCRTIPPPAMGARFTVFGHAGHADPLDGWRCCSQKRVMSRPIQVRQH